ncbi:DNA repair protein rad16 [Puccinia graminis f. sp. tritici]|uniref:DNA repair protein rad16 n=1 Tax=Puccinia graminis f. sp. tritici TaxID=56615 RepID=A0A5B0NLD4_PUCGR|nr:DNA repair protein rad16 [Puccinia graminis f. sp. tritici]KAA1090057.1 DNA repair protein rad16 [Puccinia graminis f. sp. tritici]
MAKASAKTPAPRRSARLSNCLTKTPPTRKDLDPEFTEPSSVESCDLKTTSKNKRKRPADNEVPRSVAQGSKAKTARRGHSFPMKAAKDEQPTRVAKRTKSVSSHYFQADKSETAKVGKSSEPLKDAADGDSSDESDAKITNKIITAKNKGKAPQTESQAHHDPASDHTKIADRVPASKKELTSSMEHEKTTSHTQTANTSKSKGKGKARQIDTTSEEESESDDQIVLARPRPNGRKSATPRFKPVESDEDPLEIETEMVKAAIKLSKEESKSTAPNSTSASRPIRSSSTKVTTSKHRNMLAEIDKEDDQDSDFEVKFDQDNRSSLSTLDSDSDSSEESDSDADIPGHQPTKSAQTAVAPKIRRTRRSVKIPKHLTWWQRNQMKLEAHHPELINVWGDLSQKVEVVQPSKAEQPDGLELTLLPFQLEGLYWMKKQETGPWSGGVLADEMGMGKTIQTIALILSDRVPGHRKQTLVIAPTVAIMQWRNEIEKFAKGLTVNVWHGGNRSNAQEEMENFDVVLTSFAVLESAFRRQNSGFRRKGQIIKESSLLHQINWHRVILDEAHNIKDRSCNTAKGAFELKATYRWCLSGTPLQNRVGELYSLIRFLGADPFSYYFCKLCDCKSLHWSFSDRRSCDQCKHSPMQHVCFWNNEILKPVQKYGASVVGSHGHTAFNKLKVLLDRMMLRRTKLERADDLGLPPRAVLVRRDYFTEEEEELYSSLYSDVTRKFSTYADAGTVLNNYGNIFQLITRMRQMSNHPDLVLKSRAAQAAFKTIGDANAPNTDLNQLTSIQTCRICLDEAEDAIISKCRHIFCRECIRQYLETATEQEPECPVCHLPITIDLSQDALEDENMGSKARQGVLDRLDPGKWRTSTKIEALVEELSKLNQSDHTIKSIVFSQFTVFLDLIERRLQLAGFKLARLQGNMTPEARNRTIQYFMNNNDVQVFLVSLKAGGVALNLTEASRVFIMDPWWNPAVELQAMDRIHRLGQHRPVVVTRLIIENSIESRIVELQKKKEAMTGAALGDDDQALGRLTPEDLSFLFTL